ncbi:hypothetical protein HDU89_007712 [Geranomyces variabilis]|nr:hypothetical protein HDU89_007712 [Geranomyces variabilis]
MADPQEPVLAPQQYLNAFNTADFNDYLQYLARCRTICDDLLHRPGGSPVSKSERRDINVRVETIRRHELNEESFKIAKAKLTENEQRSNRAERLLVHRKARDLQSGLFEHNRQAFKYNTQLLPPAKRQRHEIETASAAPSVRKIATPTVRAATSSKLHAASDTPDTNEAVPTVEAATSSKCHAASDTPDTDEAVPTVEAATSSKFHAASHTPDTDEAAPGPPRKKCRLGDAPSLVPTAVAEATEDMPLIWKKYIQKIQRAMNSRDKWLQQSGRHLYQLAKWGVAGAQEIGIAVMLGDTPY